MKLLYCIPALHNSGGMERVLTTKLNYLSKIKDLEIIVVTTEQMNKPYFFEINNSVNFIHLDINFNEIFNNDIISKYIQFNLKIKNYRAKLKKIIEDNNIDICISLCGKEIEFLAELDVPCKKIAEIHFTINYRNLFSKSQNKTNLFWRTLGNIRTKQLINSISKFDKFIVLTKQDEKQLNFPNVACIYNPNSFDKECGISELNNKQVISIGSLIDVKGYDMLIKAWKLVFIKHPDWQLNIFGEGENRKKLEILIQENKLDENIHLRGQTLNVISEYKQSSIYVMSSLYEGLPMVLIEAMSFGIPIVSFDCECGPREIISDGIDGFLVQQNNIIELANKICLLIEKKQLRKEMGISAFEKSKKFSQEIIMPQWLELFDEVLNNDSDIIVNK